jgi:hypothetical protein
MNGMAMGMRKVIVTDNTGREALLNVSGGETLQYVENFYREMSNFNPANKMLFADTTGGRVLSERGRKVSDLFPGVGDVHILILPDTVNA